MAKKDPKDILDENVIERLNGPNPSNRDIAEGVKLILRRLWSEEDMNGFIDRRHRELCENCPLRATSVPVPVQDAEPGEGSEPLTRRHVMIEIVKAPWFWMVVATGCAIVCAKFGLSLPMVGGGQ